jgi:integrase/recombinase XerC
MRAPRAIRQENVAETLLAAAGTPDPSSKRSKRWPERDVALVAMFCVTGIRLAEAIALRLDSITGPSGARRLRVAGKGKKERMIPLQPGLDSVLERYLDSRQERHGSDALTDPAAALLVHYDNTPLTRGRVQYVIEQLYRRAGLRAAVPAGALVHALRHSFASLAIEYGTDVAELRELLGHASLATTSRYLDANTSRPARRRRRAPLTTRPRPPPLNPLPQRSRRPPVLALAKNRSDPEKASDFRRRVMSRPAAVVRPTRLQATVSRAAAPRGGVGGV